MRKTGRETPRKTSKLPVMELDAMARLHRLATLSVSDAGLEPILDEIVDVAITLSGADFGNIQLVDPASSALRIVSHRGLPQWWVDFWNGVPECQGTCGVSLERGERVTVEDITLSPIFAGTPALEIYLRAGVRAVQSTPLISRSGKRIGMFSTHYKKRHRPDKHTLRLLDLLGRQAADIIEHVQVTAALRESEQRYRSLAEQVADGIFVADSQGRYVDANRAGCEMLGYTREEFLALSIPDLLAPDELQRLPAQYESLASGRIVQNEWHFRRKDGSVFTGELVGRQLPDGRFQGVIRDVTDRKQAEAEAQAIMEAAPGAVLVARDPQCMEIRGNRMASELLRMPPGSNLSKSAPEGQRPDNFQVMKDGIEIPPRELPMQKAAASGQAIYGYELDLVYEEGGRRSLIGNAMPLLGTDGRPRGAVGTFLDITEHKQAEEALRQSEEQFRTLANAIPQLCWMANADGGISWYNQRWYEYTGTTPEQMEGWGWQSVHDPKVLPKVLERWKDSIATGKPFDMVFPLRGADGVFRPFLTRIMPVFDRDGKVAGWFGTNTDISEQRRIEEELRKTDEERAREARRKDEFLALLSHELRNPLAAISSAIQLLSGGVTAEQRASLDELIGRQTGILRRLVDDLLDISRITHGQSGLQKERVDLLDLLQGATAAARSAVAGRSQELVVRLPPERVVFMADRVRLKQIAANLLNNASKYTDPGGTIEFSGAREGSEVVLRCRDNGRGIPLAMQKKIFEPFTRLETAGQSSEAGLGIGLALVKQLVELHGGTVSVESGGPGTGSEFTVRLPLVEAPPVPCAAGKESPAPHLRRVLSIAVVEDNPDVAQTMALTLEQAGHRVRLFADGPSALSGLSAVKPDAVLLDIGLPGMDGYEVAAKMRKKASLRYALFIGLSGFKRRKRAGKSSDGFDHYFVKPMDPARLLALLDEHGGDGAVGTAPPRGTPNRRKPLRVLLVEDNADMAAATEGLLRREGLEVRIARSGQEALEVASEFRPQLTLCDLHLPDMKGGEVVRGLRSHPATRSTQAVILTAMPEAAIHVYNRAAEQMGVDEFISKPLTSHVIRGLLAKVKPPRRASPKRNSAA
jgi:PAS domain S-box-containing protein